MLNQKGTRIGVSETTAYTHVFNVDTPALHNYIKEILAALLLKFQEKRQNLSR